MLNLTDVLIIFLLGSLGGFLSGFLGVGGGIVYVPILDYFLGKMGLNNDGLVKAILANSLFTIIFSGSVSSYKQYKLGNFYPKEILYTAITGMFSAVGMTLLIKSGNWYSRTVFSYCFAALLLIIALRMFSKRKVQIQGSEAYTKPTRYSITGFGAGIITAMSGLGGGVVMTPMFTDWMKLDIKKASSISNGVIPFFAVAVGLLNLTADAPMVSDWQIGYIVFPVVLPMIAATFVFAPMGVKVSQHASQDAIRITFATFVSIVFIKTVYTIFQS